MRKYLFIFVLIIFVSCTKNLIKVTPEYQDKFINAGKLFIQFVPEKPEIEINDELISLLGTGSKEDIYLAYFEKNFSKFVKQNSTFKQVNISSDIRQFDEKELPLNKKYKILLKIPLHSKNEIITYVDTRYTILFEDIKIHYKKGDDDISIPTDSGIIFIGGDDPLIIQLGKFLIWDNNLDKIVSYGKIDIRTKVKRNQLEETWVDAFNALSKHLFSNSPFQKRK